MSFIAGYILGCGEGGDNRDKTLEAAETLWKINIGDGWNVRIKIASDIDNAQFFGFDNTYGEISDHTTLWTLYYCVYLNEEFKYATCQNPFYMKCQKIYINDGKSNRLSSVTSISDFKVTSAETNIRNITDFLFIRVRGTYSQTMTSYSLSEDGGNSESETTFYSGEFNASKADFHGSQYQGHYIVRGNAEDFNGYVHGLYSACRKQM